MKRFSYRYPVTASLFILLICIAGLLINGCSKKDQNEKQTAETTPAPASTFFNVPSSTDPLVAAIAASLQRQDAKGNIESQLSHHAGTPQWEKAIGAATTSATAGKGENGIPDSVKFILIPFVLEEKRQTNAMLKVKISSTDTSYELIYAGQYADFGFEKKEKGKWNALNMFHLFTRFDNAIFGHKKFLVNDKRILAGLGAQEQEKATVELVGDRTLAAKLIMVPVCTDYDVCLKPCRAFKSASENRLSVCCAEWGTRSVCTLVWIDDGGPTPVGTPSPVPVPGNPPIGGTPGTPIADPCLIDPNLIQRDPQCFKDPGWQPVLPPLLNEPIDSLLKKTAQVVNKYRDSLAALCETEHKERFFNVAQYSNQLDTFRVLIGASDDEVKPNYYMTGGRILKGSWHYHPKYADGTPGSWPSGGDVAQLYDKAEGFVMIIDADNARYALVVESAASMNNWKNIFGNGPAQFPYKVRDAVLNDSRVWSGGSVYVQMTKEKLLAALGPSSVCGIGLYQASSGSGTSFTKIN